MGIISYSVDKDGCGGKRNVNCFLLVHINWLSGLAEILTPFIAQIVLELIINNSALVFLKSISLYIEN